MKERTGYDFNGVVDTGRFVPVEDDVIITSNNKPYAVTATLVWLRDRQILVPVYFNPYAHNKVSGGVWKAEMINKLRLTKFYEDDPIQFDIIQKTCPEVELIKVDKE